MSSLLTRSLVLSFLFAAVPGTSRAQNPAWPNRDASRADLMDPANWPDDPNYGYDISGTGESCIGPGLRCWTNANGGQWNMWSWVPPQAESVEGWRAEESALGSGAWTDMAWTRTTGERQVVIAVLDSGINWDERDLTNQFYINRAELAVAGLDPVCQPQIPVGHTGDPLDLDGDGVLTMRDYAFGRTPAELAAFQADLDARGNANGVAEPGDLITICSDGVDDDGNGYIDDISGWDFHFDDNDPSDDTRFGHGTGEARWSVAEANNGMGRAGFCPNCTVLMVRAGDSFIVDVQDYGQSVVFAVDSGARVIQEALGSLNHSTYMRRANDYAYEKDVLIIASAADENSPHHNVPGTADHNLYIHAIQYAGRQPQSAESFLVFNNCTNYGGQLAMSAPGTGCSSEATAVGAGIAGLIHSMAISADRPGGPLDPPLSAEETRQLITMTADDIWVPESQPDSADYDDRFYPSREGWDQRFGWGRINAFRSVSAVEQGRIPPEVDLYSPDWFRVLYPARDGSVTLRGAIDARRATSFDYVIEWATGIEPDDADFTTLAMGTDQTEAIEGDLTTWDISTLVVDNTDLEPWNRYAATVRIRVTAHYGGAIGDVTGEQRRVFSIAPDDTLLPGFPIALGTRAATDLHPGASGEGSPKLFDFDADGDLEIVYGDADGLLHVFEGDATERAGFPVRLGLVRGLDPSDPNGITGSAAYASGDVPIDDFGSSILSTPSVGDLDGDGETEIVVVTMEGDLYVVEPDGSIRTGFPIGLPVVLSGDARRMGPPNRDSIVERGAFASPALADLDDDGSLEIVLPAFDGHVHVFREDGSIQPGWPVRVTAPELWMDPADAQPSRIMTSPAIGDANGDGMLDIAVGSNEYGDDSGSGAVHLLHADGTLHAGGAEHTNWPVRLTSLELFPFVGRGIPSAAVMADINDDGRPEVAVAGTGSRIYFLDGIQAVRGPSDDPTFIGVASSGDRGPLSDPAIARTDGPLLNTFASGSFHDLDQDGHPDYVTGGAGLNLALNLAGGWENTPFSHQIGAWTTIPTGERRTTAALPGFPRRIEDYLFFVNPTSADVSGDGYPEIVIGSGGYYVHAWDACGEEAPTFPKFTGSWMIGSTAIGDITGDGMLEVVAVTRMGYLFAFGTEGSEDGTVGWPEWRHDSHNTGNYDEDVAFGTKMGAASPIECDIPEMPDAGVDGGDGGESDGGEGLDAGVDGGAGVSGGGCGCRLDGGTSGGGWGVLALLGFVAWRRRR